MSLILLLGVEPCALAAVDIEQRLTSLARSCNLTLLADVDTEDIDAMVAFTGIRGPYYYLADTPLSTEGTGIWLEIASITQGTSNGRLRAFTLSRLGQFLQGLCSIDLKTVTLAVFDGCIESGPVWIPKTQIPQHFLCRSAAPWHALPNEVVCWRCYDAEPA